MSGTEWLRGWEQQVERIGAQARQAREALSGLTGTASSASGAVTVTVTSSGALRQVVFTERAEELSRPMLAQAVLEAARRAHASAAHASAEALQPLLEKSAAEQYLAEHAPAPGSEAR